MISKYCATQFDPKYVEYVYSLRNPIDYEVFYVGKSVSPKARLSQHYTDLNILTENTGKRGIIQEIRKANLYPIMRFIDKTEIRTSIDRWEAEFKEIYWIQKYLEYGWNLQNVAAVNKDLTTMDYVSNYLSLKLSGQKIPLEHYYAFDYYGEAVYDRQRRKKDGSWIPVSGISYGLADGCYGQYWRWYSKIEKPHGYTSYDKCYNDTNPQYYSDDY